MLQLKASGYYSAKSAVPYCTLLVVPTEGTDAPADQNHPMLPIYQLLLLNSAINFMNKQS
jgi:hypothetical protein